MITGSSRRSKKNFATILILKIKTEKGLHLPLPRQLLVVHMGARNLIFAEVFLGHGLLHSALQDHEQQPPAILQVDLLFAKNGSRNVQQFLKQEYIAQNRYLSRKAQETSLKV